MYRLRLWSVKNAGLMEKTYQCVERVLVKMAPLFKAIGYERVEKPVAFVERNIKGALFDCQMCGQCALSSTGMSCPMNCPKTIRNGPCGGVRSNGKCEVKPEMDCVWVLAWEGTQNLPVNEQAIQIIQPPLDSRLKGKSAWLRAVEQRLFKNAA